MNLTRLQLHDIRRHADLDLTLTPGLNVVRGPNEAGKSTLQRAIEMVLFRRPTFSGVELEELRPWQKPDAEPTIAIEFEDDGEQGTLRKVFAGQKGTVEMSWGSQTLTDPAAVEQRVALLTGLPSEKFMRATASIHHQELDGLDKDESTLRDRLQQSMSGADRGTHAARKKLEEAIRRYRTEGVKNPGQLKVMRAEVERLEQELRDGEAALVQLENDRTALAQARSRLAEVDRELAEQQDGVARAERAVAVELRAREATEQYEHYRRAAELTDEIARLEASHPSSVPLTQIKATVDNLRQVEFRLSEMRAELAAEPDLSGYDVAIPSPRWRPWLVVGLMLIVAGAVVAGVGIAAGAALVGIVAGVAVAASSGAAFVVAARERTRTHDVRLQNELRESEIARRLSGRTKLSEKVRQTEQERAEALAVIKQPDLPTAASVLDAEEKHVAGIESRRAELRGLMGNEGPVADVAGARDRAAAEADECRHALAGMGDLGKDPERQLSAFRLAVQRLTPEREDAIATQAQAEARLAANRIDAEQVAASAESLDQARETLAAGERRVHIYETVLAALDAAESGTMKKAARFLEQAMARDIERITGGRYRRLRVDEETLTFSVYSPELRDWIDVRKLSQGTLDQLYLCARLGIVRQVTAPGNPPLVFDDPFVTFDAERAERALTMLKGLARDVQVIYLTCSDRYDAAADNVVVLPAPVERDEPEPVEPGGPAEAISMWAGTALEQTRPAEPATDAPRSATDGNGHANARVRENAQPPAAPVGPLWPDEH